MTGVQGKRLGKLPLPLSHSLALPRINEVETHPVEGVHGDLERGAGLFRGMKPPQRPQGIIAQGLYTKRYPVDARRMIATEPTCLDRTRVGLERDLKVVRRGEDVRRRLDP